ncbi:type IV pili methyl-accepting chemotaxis transducer N-terminal domain-containing protein [Amphritea balenae]|uniref:Sensor protein n=1 Tax=Amphritea balenae TaxID=452629 RepID=A0A3P1SWH0_9GAMM|nr:type IV pili methyl-accepting chemotaxis transducer N-terminal domain-containing protein [Amphritea balenae]RRD00463.1 HAMP domain-containing protein [Amphritea balenae]GGK70566.1 histidine kinase [Amphritea balenae]
MKIFKHSIIARLGASMFAISLMALISMIGSVIVAESTQGDAAGINLAGSLRMLSFRIVSEAQQYQARPYPELREEVQSTIEEFGTRINSPIMAEVIPETRDHQLYSQYRSIVDDWEQRLAPSLHKALMEGSSVDNRFVDDIEAFVPRIDKMVQLLERSTESKIKLLSLVQGISLFMTILIIFIAMLDIRNNVVVPLQQLVEMARQVSRGKLTSRTTYKSQDELGVLGRSFNDMAEELSKMYSHLENRVNQKTAQLRQSNESLQLLYETSRQFTRKDDICRRMIPVLQQLETITPVGPIQVTLTEPDKKQHYRQVSTQSLERPLDCSDKSCDRCIVPQVIETPQQTLSLPIQTNETYFGEFNAQFNPAARPNQDQIKLIETVVENLSVALSLELKAQQKEKMSLIEERAVIARELHDSLAQSLSYLKMQVTRLQILREKDKPEEQINDVINELREGLNNAYRQLRELLTTFRLKLDKPGLEPALEATIDEFSERLGFQINFNYDIRHQTLSPNEEIHVLQLVREALANVVKHAKATDVSVLLTQKQDTIEVLIEDNGVGLPDNHEIKNHYGVIIMRDRVATLNGDLNLINLPDGGLQVQAIFNPKQENRI